MLKSYIVDSRGKKLVTVVQTPNQEVDNHSLVFFCHGFVGHKITPHRMLPKFQQNLLDLGYTVCRTDCVGSGDSEGDYHYMTIEGQVQDYLAVLQVLKSEISWEKLFLHGYSMGGTTSTLLSNKIDCDGLILWSPVSNPLWNFYHILGVERFKHGLEGHDTSIDGDEVGKEFFENIINIRPLDIIKEIDIPVRIVHGSEDADVLSINGWFYNHYAKNSKLYYVEGAGHTYDNVEYQKELFETSIEYLEDMRKE